jgi:hypothetical protein
MSLRSRPCIRARPQARQHPLTVSLLLLCITFAHCAAAPPPIISVTNPHDSDKHDSKTQTRLTESSSIEGVAASSSVLKLVPRDQQTPGTSCPGSEGQWNCMTDSWQRCAAGKWSVVMQCAAGTACAPAGLTYDFKVQFSSQGTSSSSSASEGKQLTLVWQLMLMAAVVTATVTVYV